MEYAKFGDLARLITTVKSRGDRFKEPEVIKFIKQTASVLNHIHTEKRYHLDIKPLNFFVTETGVLKLGDFGVSSDLLTL